MKFKSLLPLVSLLFAFACSHDSLPSDAGSGAGGAGGKADDISFEARGLILDLSPEIDRIDAGGEVRFVLRGKTNKSLAGGKAYRASQANPPKTPTGEWTQLSEQSFELSLSAAEMRDITAGATVYLDLDLPDPEDEWHYVLAFSVRARVADYVGDPNPLVSLQPFVADGRVVHRLEAQTFDEWYGPSLVVGRTLMHGQEITPNRWRFDVPDSLLMDVLGGEQKFDFTNEFGAGRLVPMVANADFWSTSFDPGEDDAFGYCGSSVQSCLEDLPAGASDTSSCGTAIEVLACANELGVRVDQADIDAAFAAVKFEREHAVKLVGEQRADELTAKVVAAQAARLSTRAGAWYLDAAAKNESLEREGKELLYDAAAYPLEWVAPLTLRADSLAEAAPVAADALLLYMPTFDLVHSDYESTLNHLISYSYDAYLDEADYLRKGVFAEGDGYDWESGPWEGHPGKFLFLGRWFGSYVEISVGPDSEPDVYFEID